MITPELLAFVRGERARGVADAAIRQTLMTNGQWTSANVDEAFALLSHEAGAPSTLPAAPAKTPNAYYRFVTSLVGDPDSLGITNATWRKIIATNHNAFGGSLFLVFVVGLVVLAMSEGSVWPFWLAMLAVLAASFGFIRFEHSYLARKLDASESKLDDSLLTVISLRNFLVLLNVFPVIQVVGLMALTFLGPFLLLAYAILVPLRLADAKRQTAAPSA